MQPYTYAICVCCAQSNSYSDEDVARIVKYFLVDAHTDQFLKKKRDGRRRRNLLNLAEWSKEDLAGRGIREIWDFLFGEMKLLVPSFPAFHNHPLLTLYHGCICLVSVVLCWPPILLHPIPAAE